MRLAIALSFLAACACPPAEHPAPRGKGLITKMASTQPAPHQHGAHGKGPLGHRFDEGGEYWQPRFEGPDRNASQQPDRVVAAMKIEPGMTVADVGAGTGYFLKHLSPAVGPTGRVLAVDIEPTLVRYMMERSKKEGLGNVDARLGLTDDPLLADASIDRILVVNTWHHIPNREAYSAKLRTALKQGGEVWVVDFTMETSRGPAKKHRVPPSQTIAELGAGGLETRLDTELLPDQYVAIGQRKP